MTLPLKSVWQIPVKVTMRRFSTSTLMATSVYSPRPLAFPHSFSARALSLVLSPARTRARTHVLCLLTASPVCDRPTPSFSVSFTLLHSPSDLFITHNGKPKVSEVVCTYTKCTSSWTNPANLHTHRYHRCQPTPPHPSRSTRSMQIFSDQLPRSS